MAKKLKKQPKRHVKKTPKKPILREDVNQIAARIRRVVENK